MVSRLLLACLVVFLTALVGCGQRTEPYVPDDSSVGFDIAPLPKGDGMERWAATYASQGKTAKFRIELATAQSPTNAEAKQLGLTFGDGRLDAEPGSDASVLLGDLKRALEARQLPAKVTRAQSVAFTYAGLGDKVSLHSQGSGNWRMLKLFFGEGKQECEVYLNLNPVIRKAEFSIKDADYGDLLLAQLAKVL